MMAPERPGPEEPPAAGAGAAAGRLRGDRGGEGGAATAPATPAPASPVFSSLLSPVVQIKEGDGPGSGAAAAAAAPGAAGDETAPDDDDLTCLTWLQDRNLLRGMKLSPASGETHESPTSDFAEESASEPSEASSASSAGPSPGPATPGAATTGGRAKHPQHEPYDPMIHVNSKPPYSFSCLIFMAIEDSPQRALPVKEIYAWILERFPYFKNAPTGWKNSVRHNLSLNKCFRKVEKAPNLGKGSLWMVDPVYRPNLLQALQKAPFHPQSPLERIAHLAKNASHSTPNTGGSDPSSPSDPASSLRGSGSAGRLPDPELFPFLSRRLAASGVDITPVATSPATPGSGNTTDEADSLDDVDAATAMLALKHGPRLVAARKDEWFRRVKIENQNGVETKFKKKRASKDAGEDVFPVITTSPSEDHTYSAGPTVPLPPGPSSSPDEAFGEGSASEDSSQTPPLYVAASPYSHRPHAGPFTAIALSPTDAEEQRKIAEGADALLNLAGITTRKRSHSTASDHGSQYILPDYPPSPHTVTPTPVKRIAVRGRKRGGSGSGSGTSKSTALWPSSTRNARKRGGSSSSSTSRHSAPTPRGGGTNRHVLSRRRGAPHHINNNTIHMKHIKVAGRVSSGSSSPGFRDHELRRPGRAEDKVGRTRR